ncbi:MAG: ATP-grasp domain-containing protein, partial [Pseudomonadota bacterium]
PPAAPIALQRGHDLRGWGLYGVEFFVRSTAEGEEVIFSELSPRPHDTGMVTLATQDLSEFDLHARAILGLPVPETIAAKNGASAVILAQGDSEAFRFEGVDRALAVDPSVDVRVFGKPSTRPYRRMGVALARAETTDEARRLGKQAADQVSITPI